MQSKMATIGSEAIGRRTIVKCGVVNTWIGGGDYVSIRKIKNIALLKSDVEGYETHVLR